MSEFYELVVSERETKGQRYAIACAAVNSLLIYMHACMHFLYLSRKLIKMNDNRPALIICDLCIFVCLPISHQIHIE